MGRSVDFEASSSQYMSRSDASAGPSADITDYPFSFCAWINQESFPGNCIMGMFYVVGGSRYQAIAVNSSGNPQAVSRDGGGFIAAIGSTALSTATWYHITGVFTGDTDRKIYINAVEDGSDTTSVNYDSLINSTAIGRYNDGSPGGYFDGLIAHAQIYDKALSTSEMQDIMRNPAYGPSANLIAWYPLTDSSDLGVDYGTGGYDLTLSNTPIISSDGPGIGALSCSSFNATNVNYLNIASGGSGPHDDVDSTSGDCSFATWIKPEDTTNTQMVLELVDDTLSSQTTSFRMRSSAFEMGDRNTTYGRALGSTTYSADQWYFVTGVSFSDTDRKVYVNSIQDGTDTTNINRAGINRRETSIGYATDSTPSSPLTATLAHVQVFTSELSTTHMKELQYNPTGVPNSLVWWQPLNVAATDVTDFKDLSGKGYDIDSGTLPSRSIKGPPIHMFAGGI